MRRLALCILLLFASAPVQAANLHFPALTGRVVDDAHILSTQTVAELDQKLADYENGTTNQVVVVTLTSLEGDSIEDYSNRLFRHWGIGQKDKDNGVLIAVMPVGSPGDRGVHIEVGYKLEPLLTDAMTSEIIHGIMLPAFKAGDMERGVKQGTFAVLSVLGGEAKAVQAGDERQGGVSVLHILFIIVLLVLFIRNPSFFLAMMLDSAFRSGGGSGRGGDSGFSGGGGSAGGGGASGSW